MYTRQWISLSLLSSIVIVLLCSGTVQTMFADDPLSHSENRLATLDTQWFEVDTEVSPAATVGVAITYSDLSSGLILFGGGSPSGILDETWRYDEDGWRLLVPANIPPERSGSAMAYDSIRDRVVMYGGSNKRRSVWEISDTWEFDGSDWMEVHPITTPGRRCCHKMVFMDSTGRTIVFGGWGPVGPLLNDTWEFDGENWERIQTNQSPEPRHYFSMAYDSYRDRIVVFGGCTSWVLGQYNCDGQNDTWEFDGTNWQKIVTSVTPPGRSSADMVYDSEKRRMILFGGCTKRKDNNCLGDMLSDTWAYDGDNWTQFNDTNPPSRRYNHRLGYDPNLKNVVLYGGKTSSGSTGDTWEFGSARSTTFSFLNYPLKYDGSSLKYLKNHDAGGNVQSWFDHDIPNGIDGGHPPLVTADGIARIEEDAECNYGLWCSSDYYYDGHNGIDFGAPEGTAVLAAAQGTVWYVHTGCTDTCKWSANDDSRCEQCQSGYGNYIDIQHDVTPYFTRYAHLKDVFVTPFQTVIWDPANPIGSVGDTGWTEGPHFHFMVFYDTDGDGPQDRDLVDPFGWKEIPYSPEDGEQLLDTDPRVLDNMPTSHYLWLERHAPPPRTGDTSEPFTIEGSNGSIQADFPEGSYAGGATVKLLPGFSVRQLLEDLRSLGYSFWIQLFPETSLVSAASTFQEAASMLLTKPITLTVNYTDADILHLDESALSLNRWNEEQETWEPLVTVIDSDNNTVYAQSQKLGAFDLQAPLLCPQDDAEVDDQFWAAQTVIVGEHATTRVLDTANDVDWMQIAVDAGTIYQVQVSKSNGGTMPEVTVYDSGASTQLTTNKTPDGQTLANVIWQPISTETNYIKVVGAPGSQSGCDAEYVLQVSTIEPPLMVDASGPISGNVDTAYTFTATTGTMTSTVPLTYTWRATGKSPITHTSGLIDSISYTWPVTGTQNITVVVSNGAGVVTDTHVISLYAAVNADFTASPILGTAPLTVNFANQSSGDYNSTSWVLGDGSMSTDISPSHTYTRPGTYTVTLSVSGPGGNDSKTRVAYVKVSTQPVPIAAFSASPVSGAEPLTVTFIDTSAGPIDAWIWDFGDSTTSNDQNPFHVYKTSGVYTVTLAVTGPSGNDVLIRPDYVTVEPATNSSSDVYLPTIRQ